jgi:hypothetical protein
MDRPRVDEKTKDALLPKEESRLREWLPYILLAALTLAMFLGMRLDPGALWPRFLLLVVIAFLGYLRISKLRSLWKDWVAYRDLRSRDKR